MKNTNIEDIFELSPIQSGLLFNSIYQPTPGAYFIQLSYKITGPLDTIAWKKAWHLLIQDNESLRACFVWENLQSPMQVIQKELTPQWKE
jgi:hypothetical protein